MKWSIWGKGKASSRRSLGWVVGIAVVILLYVYGVAPLMETQKKGDEEIALQQKVLERYAEFLQNRPKVEAELERTRRQIDDIQKKLLMGETPQLGAANLQDLVKRLAEKNGLSLRSFRNLEPKDGNFYRKISLQIEFNPTASMMSLSRFIHDLENQETRTTISEMDLLVFNPRMPNNIQGSMVISGLMKGEKPKAKEKGKEK